MTKNQALKTAGVLIAGVGAGTVATLLYAPQSGKRTRKDLRRYANRKLHQLGDLQDTMTAFVGNGVDELKDSISVCIMDTKRAVDETRNTLSRVQERFDDGIARFAMRMQGTDD
jgi:gas vesicle protein